MWIVTLFMAGIVDGTPGGLTIFVKRNEGEKLALDLSSDATVGDLFAAAASFGVQSETLAFGGDEHRDPSVPLADIGLSGEIEVELYPMPPIRWTVENLNSWKPIFRVELKSEELGDEIISIYLQWLSPSGGNFNPSLDWNFIVVMKSQRHRNPPRFVPYRRLNTQQQQAEFPDYAQLHGILDREGISYGPMQMQRPRMRVGFRTPTEDIVFDDERPAAFMKSNGGSRGEANYQVTFKEVVFHNGHLVDTALVVIRSVHEKALIFLCILGILFVPLRTMVVGFDSWGSYLIALGMAIWFFCGKLNPE